MDVIIPPSMPLSELSTLLANPLTQDSLKIYKRTVSFVFSDGFLCSADCERSQRDAMIIGLTVGFHFAWPSMAVKDLPAAAESQLPPTSQIITAVNDMTSCICSLNYTMMISSVEPYIVGTSMWPSTTDGWLSTADTLSGAIMNGTSGSGGWCDTGACPAMVGRMLALGSKMMVVAAENQYGSETYISPGIITAARLDTLFESSPHCLCSYFAPEHTGDIFPLVRRKIAEVDNGFASATAERTFVFDTVLQVIRATKACVSGACRDVFSVIFDTVDAMAANPLAPSGTSGPLCSRNDSALCTSATCATSGACATCEAAVSVSPMLHPFMLLPTTAAARDIYWVGCSVSVECPPPGVKGYTLTNEFTFAGDDVDGLDLANFKTKFATLLAPAGSKFEGVLSGDDISAQKRAGSVVVESSLSVNNRAVLAEVQSKMATMSNADATTAFGMQVEGISALTVGEQTFAPPSPPQSWSNDDADDGSDADGKIAGLPAAAFWGIVAGGGAVLMVIVVLLCCCCFGGCMADKKSSAGSLGAGAASIARPGGNGKDGPTFKNNL
jgi:hypothetical protein